MVTVKLYNMNGSLYAEYQVSSPELAFDLMSSSGRDGLAYLTGTTAGAYNWIASKAGHTFEGFKAKLEMCCNDPDEYSRKLIEAGFCQPVSRYGL